MCDSTSFVTYHGKGNDSLHSQVIFVGLSYKLDKIGEVLPAFCSSTNSGKIIKKIEDSCIGISIIKMNLVKGVPLNKNKIRYPNNDEKRDGLEELLKNIDIIHPKIVYLFGKQVSDFVIKYGKLKRESDGTYTRKKVIFILSHHPSYIYIYKRKEMGIYIKNITSEIYKILGI